MATEASPASVSSVDRVAADTRVPFSWLSRYRTPIRRFSARDSIDSTYCTRLSGTQTTWRMPSSVVAEWSSLTPSWNKSLTTRVWPVRNTSSGILRLVSNVTSLSVCPARARARRKSSLPLASASMMNPRWAREMSSAESSTRVRTSWSTRPDPSPRSRSSRSVICRKPSRAPGVDSPLSVPSSPSPRNSRSAPPLRPSRILIARPQLAFGDRFPTDERPITGLPIAQEVSTLFLDDFGVFARDLRPGQLQAVRFPPPDGEGSSIHGDRPVLAASRTCKRGPAMIQRSLHRNTPGVSDSEWTSNGLGAWSDPEAGRERCQRSSLKLQEMKLR